MIIGIDPHKASHAACAIDENERELAQLSVRAGHRQLDQRSVGRSRSRSARGRSSRPVGSAISSLSSLSLRASAWSMCRPRCRRGCGCSGLAGRTRTIRTTLERSRSQRCGRRPSLGAS